jgi:hypothetical protein
MLNLLNWNDVPSLETLKLYVRGEITDEQAGLHNIYDCHQKQCAQCEAKVHACWYWQGVTNGWLEDIYGWLDD